MNTDSVQRELDGFVRMGEAMRILGKSYHTVYRWAHKGLIPHLLSPTGQLMFKREDLENFYQKRIRILK